MYTIVYLLYPLYVYIGACFLFVSPSKFNCCMYRLSLIFKRPTPCAHTRPITTHHTAPHSTIPDRPHRRSIVRRSIARSVVLHRTLRTDESHPPPRRPRRTNAFDYDRFGLAPIHHAYRRCATTRRTTRRRLDWTTRRDGWARVGVNLAASGSRGARA